MIPISNAAAVKAMITVKPDDLLFPEFHHADWTCCFICGDEGIRDSRISPLLVGLRRHHVECGCDVLDEILIAVE